jgi:drug/metabolite transporter (DMT)-like permease
MGVIVFGTTSLRQFGVNNLPGSIFGLLISTSILFNMALSWLVLRRRYNAWHYAAVALGVASVLVLGLMDLQSSGNPAHAGTYNFVLGTACALGAGFFIALMSVWSSKVTSTWPDKNLRVIELTIVGALVAALLLVPLLFATGEAANWPGQLAPAWRNQRTLLVAVTLAMPAAKALVRSSKYATIARSSALFFEFTQATANLVSAVTNVFLYGETWTNGFIIATVIMMAAFAAYVRGMAVQAAAEAAAAQVGSGRAVETTPAGVATVTPRGWLQPRRWSGMFWPRGRRHRTGEGAGTAGAYGAIEPSGAGKGGADWAASPPWPSGSAAESKEAYHAPPLVRLVHGGNAYH